MTVGDDVSNGSAEEANAAYWERLFASRPWGSYPPEELVRFMARNFRSVPRKSDVRTLEIGCGPGPNIWFLVREGFSVAGIDGSATAIRQARERLTADSLPNGEPRVDLRVGDFALLPWPAASFDAVIDIEALYSNPLATITRCLEEVLRVLKPGGLFFGKMFGTGTTGSDSGEAIEPGTRRNPTTGPCAGNAIAHFFTAEELRGLFAAFDTVAIDALSRTDGTTAICEWLLSARKQLRPA